MWVDLCTLVNHAQKPRHHAMGAPGHSCRGPHCSTGCTLANQSREQATHVLWVIRELSME